LRRRRNNTHQELVSYEVLGAKNFRRLVCIVRDFLGRLISTEFCKVLLEFAFTCRPTKTRLECAPETPERRRTPTCKDFFREQVLLVEKKDDGDGTQPPVVPYGLEEVETFAQPVLGGILPQHHVVRATRRDEDDRRDVIEALDPFSSFVSLATDIEHAAKRKKNDKKTVSTFPATFLLLEVDFVNLEERFEYAAGKYTAAQDVLLRWSVIGLFDYAHLIKEVLRTIYQLVFVTPFERDLQKEPSTIVSYHKSNLILTVI
jgi:hypothetical protein